MKMTSWFMTPARHKKSPKLFFLLSPYLSGRSLNHREPQSRLKITLKLGLNLSAFLIAVNLTRRFLIPLTYWKIVLFSPSILFLTETLGAFGQLVFHRKRRPIVAIHHRPLMASSLSSFWGRRWNVWVQDWLRDLNRSFRKSPLAIRILVTFIFSGLFHEIMFNLPYWIYYQQSFFGTMMLYFFIQGLGLWIGKVYMQKASPFWQRIYLWLVVLLPAPIFINVPLLHFLGLDHA
jgi:hypothetical protein